MRPLMTRGWPSLNQRTSGAGNPWASQSNRTVRAAGRTRLIMSDAKVGGAVKGEDIEQETMK